MRNPLNKRIPRDLKKNSLKYLGMILILVCTISAGTSFQTAMSGAIDYLERIKDDNIQEDGFFETMNPIADDCFDEYDGRDMLVAKNYYATEHDFADSCKVLLFDEREEIDLPTVFEGRLPESANEIAIDHVFARNKELPIGGKVTFLGHEYDIVGTVSLPDYTALFMNNTDLVMNTEHFGVALLDHDGFKQIDEGNVTYRYSYRFTDRDLKTSEKNDEAVEIQKYLYSLGNPAQTLLTRSQNQSIAFLEMDIETDGPFITVFVYILVALIAFIFAILTGNTIEKESVIIGTLRSLGYRKGEIIWHYLKPTLIVALVGSVLGNVLGYTLMLDVFADMYIEMYSIGPLIIKFNVPMFLLTTLLPIGTMILINYFMMAGKMSLSPLKFLRRELHKGKRRKAVKLPNFKFVSRFRLRVLLQNFGSYVMLFVGVFLASFLLMFGIGLDPLIDHYTETVGEAIPYEYQYILKAPVDVDEGDKILAYEMDTFFDLSQKDVGVTLFGIDEDSEFFKDAYNKDGAVISSAASAKLFLKAGDIIKLKDANNDKEYEFEIKDVYPYDAALTLFIDKDELCDILDYDDGTYNCILSSKKLDIDENLIAKQVGKDDMVGAIDQVMDSFGTLIVVINIFSVVVYIIMIYILTRVVIDKNALSISYMKVFGYNSGEIRKLFLTTTTIVVIVSLIVCIPVEIWLFKLTLIVLSALIEGYMSFYLPMWVYIAIIAIGIAAYFFINAFNIRSVKRIPMTDALKNRE